MNSAFVKNTKRNLIFGFINKIVIILCPFITRTVFRYILGTEYLGLNNLFSSLLSVLSVAELGFGSAIIYCMYKPVAENNIDEICPLLNFYKKVYKVIGIIILFLGILLIPFLPYLIAEGAYPHNINLSVVYSFYLINATISYFMYAYMEAIIIVYQRDDIRSLVNTVVILMLNVSQILVLLLSRNYYLYAILIPVFTVINNIWTAYQARKRFPQYSCYGNLSKMTKNDIKLRVGGTVISKICKVSRNSFDSVCTSLFLGLTMTAIYNNYYYILTAMSSIMSIVSASIRGGIGNHVVTKSKAENYNELKQLDFAYMLIASWFVTFYICLIQPFMEIWMGKDMLLSMPLVALLGFYFYLLCTGDMRSIYTEANGLWWEHRHRSIIEAAGNLLLNVILGKYYGIYGIIIATIMTILFCNFLWGSYIVFKYYFGLKRIKDYFSDHFKYMIMSTLTVFVTYTICLLIPIHRNIFLLLSRGFVCLFVFFIVFFVKYYHNPLARNIFKHFSGLHTNTSD